MRIDNLHSHYNMIKRGSSDLAPYAEQNGVSTLLFNGLLGVVVFVAFLVAPKGDLSDTSIDRPAVEYPDVVDIVLVLILSGCGAGRQRRRTVHRNQLYLRSTGVTSSRNLDRNLRGCSGSNSYEA